MKKCIATNHNDYEDPKIVTGLRNTSLTTLSHDPHHIKNLKLNKVKIIEIVRISH